MPPCYQLHTLMTAAAGSPLLIRRTVCVHLVRIWPPYLEVVSLSAARGGGWYPAARSQKMVQNTITNSYVLKQSTWLRTDHSGGCWRLVALRTCRGAYQRQWRCSLQRCDSFVGWALGRVSACKNITLGRSCEGPSKTHGKICWWNKINEYVYGSCLYFG